MVETWSSLTEDQWATASWCKGWSVQDAAGHVLAAAEQTPVNFYKELTAAGFRFNVFTDRGAKRLAAVGPDELEAPPSPHLDDKSPPCSGDGHAR